MNVISLDIDFSNCPHYLQTQNHFSFINKTEDYLIFVFFFSICVFFHNHSRIAELQGKLEGFSLTPRYHFHSFHRYLNISRAITAESFTSAHRLQSDSNWQPLVSERKSLTTKLRALKSTLEVYAKENHTDIISPTKISMISLQIALVNLTLLSKTIIPTFMAATSQV